jgi:flavoprotein
VDINERYKELVEIEVFISKAADQVIKYYEISHEIENNFNNIWVEINANSTFLACNIQLGK